MAGNYADVPGHRMAYDRDGTTVAHFNPDVADVSIYSSADMAQMNDEDSGQVTMTTRGGGGAFLAFVFPELRSFVGWFASLTDWGINLVQSSPDTTNGKDGSWSDVTSATTTGAPGDYRTAINDVSVASCKGVRFRSNSGTSTDYIRVFHIYGTPAAGEATNRLRFWHPTTDAEVGGAYFDWGDQPRSTTVDRDFRVKNPSTLTAQSVTLSNEALTDTTPTNTSAHTFSVGGGPFESTLSIGDLAPGAVSPVVTVRRTTPPDAALSLWSTRMVASAAAWV